jgi:hypothetical protein
MNTKRRSWLESLADPVFAAMIGVTQAVAWFVVRGDKHGFPASRPEVRDAVLFSLFQLAVPLSLCIVFRFIIARRARR